MPRTKLTPADRAQIAQRFRETTATATSLAAEYEVSISTIIRILKEELTEAVYESLVPQKRAGRWQEPPPPPATPTPSLPSPGQILAYRPVATDPPAPPQPPPPTPELIPPTPPTPATVDPSPAPEPVALEEPEATALPEWAADAQDDWEDEEGDEDEGTGDAFAPESISQDILPLEAADLPHPCYLVVDRFAELVARPLKEFSRWGELPSTSETARTLPVFDNHRVAKRFSGRAYRVLKVPDATLIYKTSGYLYDKGITHLLVNGQVYLVTRPGGQAEALATPEPADHLD
ncbi:transposase [Gloeomargarita sp.]